MNRPPLTVLHRLLSSSSPRNELSLGFSGAGFLGCYHVGVAACLHRQGLLPDLNASSSSPLVTGVSAGSMIAAAILAGVNPDPDGMEIVLEAARRTRELATKKTKAGALDFNVSLDVLTPGYSLIDQVENPFRVAIVNALGGRIPDVGSVNKNAVDEDSSSNVYDIDPDLFRRRFPDGSLRIGLTDRRILGPRKLIESYRYVDSFRDVDDVVATCMLSSYIPGGTGPMHLKDKMPGFLSGFFDIMNLPGAKESANNSLTSDQIINDTVHRAGVRLREMESVGLVKHGKTGLATVTQHLNSKVQESVAQNSTDFWDGGIVVMFPTFDDKTIIIAPLNGVYSPNPAICPIHASEDNMISDDEESKQPIQKLSPLYLQSLIRSYIPTTFRHCNKAELGLNSKNAKAALKMIFSSEDEELYKIFREGYDDARRFLDENGQLRVFTV